MKFLIFATLASRPSSKGASVGFGALAWRVGPTVLVLVTVTLMKFWTVAVRVEVTCVRVLDSLVSTLKGFDD